MQCTAYTLLRNDVLCSPKCSAMTIHYCKVQWSVMYPENGYCTEKWTSHIADLCVQYVRVGLGAVVLFYSFISVLRNLRCRDGKTYKCTSNSCVNFFLAWVKYGCSFPLYRTILKWKCSKYWRLYSCRESARNHKKKKKIIRLWYSDVCHPRRTLWKN